MSVRRRTDGRPDAWWVDFRVGGVRYRYTVRAADEAEALAHEAGLRTKLRIEGNADAAWQWTADGRDRYRDPWTRLLQNARTRARLAGERFGLTRRELDKIIARASGHCELTGLPFSWDWQEGARRRPFAPSLDRIDHALGYAADNVRLVCVAVNIAINEWGEDTFLKVSSAYVARNFSKLCPPQATASKSNSGYEARA